MDPRPHKSAILRLRKPVGRVRLARRVLAAVQGESMLCHWEQDTEELRTCLQNLEGRSVEAVGHRGPDPGVWLRFAEGLVLDLLPYPDDVSVLATLSTRAEYVEMTDEGTLKRTERRGYRPLTEEEVSPPGLK